MKRKTLFLVSFFCGLVILGATEGTDGSTSPSALWGFSGSIEMGGMRLSGDGFDLVDQAGYGTLGTDSLIAHFSAAVNYRKPGLFDLALTFSYLGGGAFTWQDIFGDTGSEFPLFGDSLAVQIELQPLFPLLHGFHPFAGVGYSLTNGLVDNFGDGFVAGRGPFLVGGLYIFNSLGLGPYLPFYLQDDNFFGLRISVYYRFPYTYRFRLDWDEFNKNYNGFMDFDAMRSFFENTAFDAGSFAFSMGVSIGFLPYSADKK